MTRLSRMRLPWPSCIVLPLSTVISITNADSTNPRPLLPVRSVFHTIVDEEGKSEAAKPPTQSYTYAIVGYGVAGQSGLKALTANRDETIVIVDPNLNSVSDRTKLSSSGKVTFIQDKVVALDDKNHLLTTLNGEIIAFDKCLLSFGRGDDTPLRLKTRVDPLIQEKGSSVIKSLQTPNIHSSLLQSIAMGNHVTIVGGGTSWDSLDVASFLANESKAKGIKGSVTLLLPCIGPLSHILPGYLSVAVGKRLKSKGVEIIPHAEIEYVIANESIQRNKAADIDSTAVILASKAYDPQTKISIPTDMVIFPGFRSSLSMKSNIMEMDAGGGIQTNAFLQASDSIFVAGEAASIQSKGVSGRFIGTNHAYFTGQIAGQNMSHLRRGKRMRPYENIPVIEVSAPESGIHFTFIGSCSSHYDMHGFWWKIPDADEPVSSSPSSSSSLSSSSTSSSKSNASSSSSSSSSSFADDLTFFLKDTFYKSFGSSPNRHSHRSGKGGQGTNSLGSVASAPLGKHNMKATSPASSPSSQTASIVPPPLGIGVVLYVDPSNVVSGILISGVPPSSTEGESSYSEEIFRRARVLLGTPLSVDPYNPTTNLLKEEEKGEEDGETADRSESDNGKEEEEEIPLSSSNTWMSERLQRLQRLATLATAIIVPAVSNVSESREGIPSFFPRPMYRHCRPSRNRERTLTALNSSVGSVSESDFFFKGSGAYDTRADKIQIAYRAGVLGQKVK